MYFVGLYLSYRYLYNETNYMDTFSDKLSTISIQKMIAAENSTVWINYTIAALLVFVSSFLVSICISIGTLVNEVKIRFTHVFSLAVKSHIIFALNFLFITVLKAAEIIPYTLGNAHNDYWFQSALMFFDVKKLPAWSYYPLQSLNITELIHILLLSFGTGILLNRNYWSALKFVGIWYGLGLVFWIVFTVFLQTII